MLLCSLLVDHRLQYYDSAKSHTVDRAETVQIEGDLSGYTHVELDLVWAPGNGHGTVNSQHHERFRDALLLWQGG